MQSESMLPPCLLGKELCCGMEIKAKVANSDEKARGGSLYEKSSPTSICAGIRAGGNRRRSTRRATSVKPSWEAEEFSQYLQNVVLKLKTNVNKETEKK